MKLGNDEESMLRSLLSQDSTMVSHLSRGKRRKALRGLERRGLVVDGIVVVNQESGQIVFGSVVG